jgi:hypothetical protein
MNQNEDASIATRASLLDRLRALPGVTSASATKVMPLDGGLWTRHVAVQGYTFRADESEDVGFNAVAPKFFATVGTPLLSGREFGERDTNTASKVAIVNESFARYFFGGHSPLGRRVTSVKVRYEIVGVVKDAQYQSLRAERMKTVYIPWMQREEDQPSSYKFLARVAAGNPMSLSPALERLVPEADPGLGLSRPQTYLDLIDRSIMTERMMATLGGLFGVLALMVASLGIFGVMAFQVSRRINELGVRMALGASRGHIVALVLLVVVGVRVLQQPLDARRHLAEVVGRDVRRHSHGDAGGTVDEQVREPAGQDGRFLHTSVVIRDEIDCLLIDFAQHLHRQRREPCLCVVADEAIGDEGVVGGVNPQAVHRPHTRICNRSDARVGLQGGIVHGQWLALTVIPLAVIIGEVKEVANLFFSWHCPTRRDCGD